MPLPKRLYVICFPASCGGARFLALFGGDVPRMKKRMIENHLETIERLSAFCSIRY